MFLCGIYEMQSKKKKMIINEISACAKVFIYKIDRPLHSVKKKAQTALYMLFRVSK